MEERVCVPNLKSPKFVYVCCNLLYLLLNGFPYTMFQCPGAKGQSQMSNCGNTDHGPTVPAEQKDPGTSAWTSNQTSLLGVPTPDLRCGMPCSKWLTDLLAGSYLRLQPALGSSDGLRHSRCNHLPALVGKLSGERRACPCGGALELPRPINSMECLGYPETNPM